MREKENIVAQHKCHSKAVSLQEEKIHTATHTSPWVAAGFITHLFRSRATPTGRDVRSEWNYHSVK